MAKIILFDIEATNLDADFGTTLAFGWKEYGKGKAQVISLLDFNDRCKSCRKVDTKDDVALLGEVYEILADADMWVTWYGIKYDVPFLNTRMLEAGFSPLPNIPHVDLWFTARHHLKLSSNRLANVQDFLQLKDSKTPLTRRVWREAEAGDAKSQEYIVDHCLKDVKVLEGAYERLRPYVRTHPRVAGFGPCRACGSKRMQKRGIAITKLKNEKQRVQCQACGAWDTRPLD